MKLYFCCESLSGYVLKIKFYSGANTTGPERGHEEQIVRDVIEQYQDVGHTVYMDSYFSTHQLFSDLLSLQTTACGTVRQDRRGLPKHITKKELRLQKGDVVERDKEDIVAVRYQDKRDIMLLSTIHDGRVVDTGRRDKRTDEPIHKPNIVHQYNRFMKGVDLIDMYLSFYSFNSKTLKRWKRATTHLIHLACIQAHILYRKSTTSDSPFSL
ncbi:piggyBac transposable element-derived protein 4-like [Aplysia californica]|uniref:PiggyBac transposable element-derived protein 4-like n=1 Tax=Aplysia californica TaxID=6500 RepID=A0ABM1VPD2_APLCA|nr:piggyBac transposable element-derived protein 4-like [Aplysia californica]